MEKSLSEIVAITGGRIRGDADLLISDVAPLKEAKSGELTFMAGRPSLKAIEGTGASAVIAKPDAALDDARTDGPALILVENPHLAFAKAISLFRPAPKPSPGVHTGAEIGEGVLLGKGVSIGPFAVVEEGAEIGDEVILHASVVIERHARIGAGSIIHAGAVVRQFCEVGKRVIIHCNAVIGSDGFGYAREGQRYVKIPQMGRVRLGDDVEIGASATIDRATLGETVIKRGTKIDNLVQIAHNVTIGEDVVLAAQTGIAGSTSVGEGSQFGGQVGVGGHIDIGARTLIGAKSGISQNLPGEAAFSGIPAIPHGKWLRAQAIYAKLPELKKKIKELEKRIQELENNSD